MQGLSLSALGDLLPATEAVGNNQVIGWGASHGGKKLQFSDGDRDIVLIFFEPKRPRHPATSRCRSIEFDTHPSQDRLFVGHLHDGFVMTVAMNQRLAGKPGYLKMLCSLFQKFAQQKGLPRQPLSARVVGEKIEELIPKNGGTAWLEHDNRHTGIDLGRKRIQSSQQQFLGPVQHAKVIQWPPATQGCARYCHVKSRRFENVNRRLGGVRMEIVVEGIRPEHDLTWLVWRRV